MPSWLRTILIVIIVLLVGVAAAAPIGPLPGFRLGGSEAAAPDQWPARLPDEVRLANYSGLLPHVVIIWVVESDNKLYVIGDPESTWVQGVTSSPEVRLRIEDSVYELTAERLDPGPMHIFQTYIDRYKDDYPEIIASFPPPEQFAASAAVFELTRQ